jgi:hypothetical protein
MARFRIAANCKNKKEATLWLHQEAKKLPLPYRGAVYLIRQNLQGLMRYFFLPEKEKFVKNFGLNND